MKLPFDISHLRCIEYENTPTGLKALADKLKLSFEAFEKNPGMPDNHFLETAKLIKYQYPNYASEKELEPETEAIMALMRSPELMALLLKQSAGEPASEKEIFDAIIKTPDTASLLINSLVKSGSLTIGNSKQENRQTRRTKSK